MPRTIATLVVLAALIGCATTSAPNSWRAGAREVLVEIQLWRLHGDASSLVLSPMILVYEDLPSRCSIESGEPERECYAVSVLVEERDGHLTSSTEVTVMDSSGEVASVKLMRSVGDVGRARSKDLMLEVRATEIPSTLAELDVPAPRLAQGRGPANP